jgi:DNA-binding response OmpR family regulator
LCKFIKHSPEAKHVPVVMLSGKGGFFDKIRGRLAGATAYLTKPFDPEALVLAVDQQSDRFWGLKSRGPTATSPSRSPTRSYSPASIGSSEKPDRGSARAQRRADLPGGTHGR